MAVARRRDSVAPAPAVLTRMALVVLVTLALVSCATDGSPEQAGRDAATETGAGTADTDDAASGDTATGDTDDTATDTDDAATDNGTGPDEPTTDEEAAETDADTADTDDAADADDTVTDGEAGSVVDCSREALGEDDVVSFTTAHEVVDGRLGEVCLGVPSPRLVEAWDTLVELTPPLQLSDLAVFSAFESTEDGDEVTLAFVSALDTDGSVFQMSINTAEYIDDDPLSLITLAHEFAHVFTSTPTQIDRTVEAQDGCATFDNGEGCFLPDSLIARWVEEFWDDGLLAGFDPAAETTSAGGQARCDRDGGFFGSYAASHPEEDFAESFAAYVFGVEPFTDGQAARLDWFAERPGLVEFRDRALAAGYDSLPHEFDACGFDAG